MGSLHNQSAPSVLTTLRFHPIADCWRLMEGRDFENLVSSVKEHGQLLPILTLDNLIVDGRNRYLACIEAGVEPWVEEWQGNGKLQDIVQALNENRRHDTDSQRAMVAARLANLGEGRPDKTAQICAVSQADAAEMMDVSRRTVQTACEVIEHGEPELVKAVERGDVAVSTAAQIAELPPAAQRQAVERIEAGEKPAQVKRDLSPLMSSQSDQWNTPKSVVDLAALLLREIDLDPCSNDGTPNVPAKNVYRKSDDGLKQDWSGRVYMNPPYGDAVFDWVSKLVSEYEAGKVTEAIALVAARVDTKWFQLFEPYYMGFVRGRLTFGDAQNSATFPSAVVYLGKRVKNFRIIFADLCMFPNRSFDGK